MTATTDECMEVSQNPTMVYDETKIENLILKAKYLQKQNSIQDPVVHSIRRANSQWETQLPPVWDNVMIQDYVEGIVSEYLDENKVSDPVVNSKSVFTEDVQDSHFIESINVNDLKKNSQSNCPLKPTTIDKELQMKWELVEKSEPTVILEKKVSLPIKPASTRTSEIRKKYIQESNTNRSSLKISSFISRSNKTPRVQYSLFTGNAKGLNSINFSEVHPELSLDNHLESSTLFPRRYTVKPEEKLSSTDEVPTKEHDIDIVDTNKIALKTNVTDKTWSEELLSKKPRTKIKKHKKTKVKQKKLHSKIPEVISPLPELIQLTAAKEESILTSPNLNIAQNNELNEKLIDSDRKPQEQTKIIYDKPFVHNMPTVNEIRNKFRIQNFPVLCIRGNFKIQKVVSISIEGDNNDEPKTLHENSINRRNVQYIEYVHNDKKLDDMVLETPPMIMPEKLDESNNLDNNLDYAKKSKINEDGASLNKIPRINKFFQPFKDMTNFVFEDETLSKSKLITTIYSSNSEFSNSPIILNSTSETFNDSSSTQINETQKLTSKREAKTRKKGNSLKSSTTDLPASLEENDSWFKQTSKREKSLNNDENERNILENVLSSSETKPYEFPYTQMRYKSQINKDNEKNVQFNSPNTSYSLEEYKIIKNTNTKYLDNIFQQIENGDLEGLRMFNDRQKNEICNNSLVGNHQALKIPKVHVVAPHLPFKAKHCFDIDEYSKFLYNEQITEMQMKQQPVKKELHNNCTFKKSDDFFRISETQLNSIESLSQSKETSSRNSTRLRKNENPLYFENFYELDIENESNNENSTRSEKLGTNQENLFHKRKTSSDPEVQRAVNKFLKSLYYPNTKSNNHHSTYSLSKNDKTINQNFNDVELTSYTPQLLKNYSKRKRKTFLTSETSSSFSIMLQPVTFEDLAKSNKNLTHSNKFYNYFESNCKSKNAKFTDFDSKQTLVQPTIDYDSNLLSSSLSSISLNFDLSQLKEDSNSSSSSKELTSWKQLAKLNKPLAGNNLNKLESESNLSKVISLGMSEGEVLSLGEV